MRIDQEQATISYEDLVRDPELVEVLRRRGRRIRAIEGGKVISAVVRLLFGTAATKAPEPAVPCFVMSQGVRLAVSC